MTFSLFCADVLDQLADVAGLEVGSSDDGHRNVGDPADAVEGGVRIIGQFAVQGGAGSLGDVVEQKGVAVGLGPGGARGAQGAPSTTGVLDQHLLPERAGHRFGDQSGHGVGGAAGRVRDQHA